MTGVVIYLLRHGQTVWNREGRLQGQRDSPLTLAGIGQARAMAARLAREIADPQDFTVVASPLGRAWQSAVIVAESLSLDARRIRFERRLMEHGFGAWEGLTLDELEAAHPGAWARREADKWDYRVSGGESCGMVAARAAAWLGELPLDARLIVVGHGLAGRVLRGLYAGLAESEILTLDEPQDAVFRLSGGRVERLEADSE